MNAPFSASSEAEIGGLGTKGGFVRTADLDTSPPSNSFWRSLKPHEFTPAKRTFKT